MLELDNVSKHYPRPDGSVAAVTDVSFTVAPEQFVAVRGPSGCGKTTLLLAAGGLLRPDRGSVRIEGQDPYALTPDDRARLRAQKIGFVFQQFHLLAYFSVLENVLAPSVAADLPDARGRADELLARFGLAGRAGHKPAELSTGERQRVALARALLNGPALLLADEPTGNLDGDNAEIVLEALAEFARTGGAVLLVTHDPRAAAHAQRILHLNQGRLQED